MLSTSSVIAVLFSVAFAQFVVSDNDDHAVPVGHLKPFGAHRPPDEVDEIPGFPSADRFMDSYVRHSRPLVFRGVAKEFPAFKLWTEEYLKSNYADLEVRLEAKKEKQGYTPVGAAGLGRDTIAHFIDSYHQTNRYMVSELPTPMWGDVSIVPSMSCGPFPNKFVEIDIWMSGGDTSSLIHKDAYNTINCVLNGTKEWKLIEFKHQDKIYQFEEEMEGIGGFSRINASSVDLLKYPLVSQAPWSYTTVEKGDCLYLPGSMWHQVQSHGDMNVAVAFLFNRFEDKSKKYDFSNCKSANGRAERYVPLSQIDVDLQYPGHGDMSMGIFDFESGFESLKGFFNRTSGEFSLKLAVREFHSAWQGGTRKQLKEKAFGLRALLRKWTDKDNVTFKDTEKMSRQGVREVMTYIHPLIPENTKYHEFLYIQEEEIARVMRLLLSEHGVLNRKQFVAEYVKQCGGTEMFAEDIFARLQQTPEADNLSEDGVKARLKYAARKYHKTDAFETGFIFSDDGDEAFKEPSDFEVDEDLWEQAGFSNEEAEGDYSDAYEPTINKEEFVKEEFLVGAREPKIEL